MSLDDRHLTPLVPDPPAQPAARQTPRWQRGLQRLFSNVWVELTIGLLIVMSVALTVAQLILQGPEETADSRLEQINHTITWIFAGELSLRFLAASKKGRFFREYWIDILSLAPLMRPFRAARAIRLLRLLRVLRLIGVVNRLSSHFPDVFRRGAMEYLVVSGLLMLTVLLGTGAILAFEEGDNPEFDSWDEAFWFSVYSLFAGEPIPESPKSTTSKVVTVAIMFMGLTIFAMFTGTVTAFMVDRLQTEGRHVDWDQFSHHTIICGYNRKAEIVIHEYCLAHSNDQQPVVLITEFEDGQPPLFTPSIRSQVRLMNDDFTRVSALELAGIHRAKACIILSDLGENRSEQDADARTILAALTVEKLNPQIYTCAELHNRAYGTHLEMGHVNDFVVSGEHSAYLLAQAAINQGLMGVFAELLTQERGNQFYRIIAPDSWVGRSFWDVFCELKKENDAILVAIHSADGTYRVNPKDYTLAEEDQLILIAEQDVQLKA